MAFLAERSLSAPQPWITGEGSPQAVGLSKMGLSCLPVKTGTEHSLTEVSLKTEDTVRRGFTAAAIRTMTPETRRHSRWGQERELGISSVQKMHVEPENSYFLVFELIISTKPEVIVKSQTKTVLVSFVLFMTSLNKSAGAFRQLPRVAG